MAIDGVSGRTSYIGSGILNLRSQLDTLTEQLSSGKVSTTYAGQGDGRSLAIGLRSQLGKLDGYADTATNVNTRINVANLSLQRLVAINSTVKGAAVSAGATIDNTGQTAGQKTAGLSLLDSVDMLNAQAGDRYLFSGRATDTAPVTPADIILGGNGAAVAGLKQVIAERQTADLGSDGLGRLVIPANPTPTSVQIGEDFAADPTATPPVAASVFGLKLAAVSTTIAGATATQPTATPAATTPPSPLAITVDLGTTTPPNDGDTVKFTFNLPDGTSEDIVLTASTATPTPTNGFAIGADNTATATNMKAALTAAVRQLANGPLAAASAVTAGDNFFDEPPMRVNAPQTYSATAGAAGATQNNNRTTTAGTTTGTAIPGASSSATLISALTTPPTAGQTITVNNTTFTITGTGGASDATHISVDDDLSSLLTKVGAAAGGSATLTGGAITVNGASAASVTLSGTALGAFGLTANTYNGTSPGPVTAGTTLNGAASSSSDALTTAFTTSDTIVANSTTIRFFDSGAGGSAGSAANSVYLDLASATVGGLMTAINTATGGTSAIDGTTGAITLTTGTAADIALSGTGVTKLGLGTTYSQTRTSAPAGSASALASATTLVAGTKDNTVYWYNGEPDSANDPARGSAVAQVDQNSTVRYGARADEQALRTQLQTIAVFAAVTTKLTDVNPAGKIAALNQRIANNLAAVPGTQSIQDIQADFAGAQAAVKATTDRQAQTKTISQTLLDSIEGVNNDEIATKILALQTALQASYQTTSQLYQMSLVKYL